MTQKKKKMAGKICCERMAKAQNICFEDCDHVVTSEQVNKRKKKTI